MATSSCGGSSFESEAVEAKVARDAATVVVRNCRNHAAPNEKCASVEELSRISPSRWSARIRLFNGRDVCVEINLRRFKRVGDQLRGVDRIAC